MWLGGNTLGSFRCPPGAQRVMIEKKILTHVNGSPAFESYMSIMSTYMIWNGPYGDSSSQCPIVTTANLMERKQRAVIDVAAV